MARNIDLRVFKILLSESTLAEKPQTQRIYGLMDPPNIKFTVIDTRIIISGDFEFNDDLIFKREDVFNYDLIIDGGCFKNIIFEGGTFTKFVFRRGEFNGFVSIRGGKFDNLVLLGGNFKHWLGTLNGMKKNLYDNALSDNTLAEEELVINRFQIEGGTFEHNIWISGGLINRLELKCVSPNHIHCMPSDDIYYNETEKKFKKLYNSKPQINQLVISRYLSKASFFHCSEISINELSFELCTNLGNITFSDVTVHNSLNFINSDVGKTTFIDCKFNEAQLNFRSSRINEIIIAGTILPNSFSPNSEESSSHQYRLAMSQIKKAYQSMGDFTAASRYKAEELDSLLSEPDSTWDKINLKLNKISNNFGLKWERAICIILIGNIFLFTAFCYSLGFYLDFNLNGLKVLFRNSALIFEFINPIHKVDSLTVLLIKNEGNLVSAATIFISSISKIFNAYMIYQFISAFRRHGKN